MCDSTTIAVLAFLGPLGWPELIVLGLVGILIFGKRLPEVGKSIGRGIVEFKKGLAGIDEQLDDSKPEPPRIEDQDTSDRTMSSGEAESKASSTGQTPDSSA